MLICMGLCVGGWAQHITVQWASEVVGVSSEYGAGTTSKQYKAIQALGKPNKLPAAGSSPCAWSPAKPGSVHEEWIKVGFEYPMRICQLVVAESFNPGTISKIEITDTQGTSHRIYENTNPGAIPEKGRMLSVLMDTTTFPITSAKVVLKTNSVPGWNHIDAIGISTGKEKLEAKINLPEKLTTSVEIEHLPVQINSAYDEILPIISPDGKTLYFDRKNHPENFRKTSEKVTKDDIWVTTFENGQWTTARQMPAPLNNFNHNYICSVTPDGNTLLLGNVYHQDGSASGGVSISNKIKEGWSFPEKLIIQNYENLSKFSEYSLANNKKVLLLAIEDSTSYGDRDLYVSFKTKNATGKEVWSKPLNLGSKINTAAPELTPFLASDGYTLYFSSMGFSGYGSADMYMARRLDDTWTNWTEPVNLGPVFNSEDWDASYTIDASGEYAYFVSYKNSIDKSADLFRARLPETLRPDPVVLISGKVLNHKTHEPLAAEIVYEDLRSGKEVGTAFSDPSTGIYKIILPVNHRYGFWARAESYLSQHENIDLSHTAHYSELQKDLYLTPLEVGQSIVLNNIFFYQSKDLLLKESFSELNRIAETILKHPHLEVVLEGHTDIGGDPTLNMELSKERVKAVKTYLISKGVDSLRIKTKAFGSTRPLSRSRDPEHKKMNRRVEFRVLKM
ncbi:OmpA family protein [Rapidithrix thailandica]|uniref:OmpA family protein n=1 Tax=Rapidithrix thailandica TaxID=413964 RepID=A0AAW9SB32_9BACT